MNVDLPTREIPDEIDQAPAPAVIRETRRPSSLVLPRHVQSWIMVGLALLIVAIILVTGQTTPVPMSVSPAPRPTAMPVTPDRVKSYQDRLAEQEMRLRQEQARADLMASQPIVLPGAIEPAPARLMPIETVPGTKGEDDTLRADNVAFSRRGDRQSERLSPVDASRAVPTVPVASPVSASLPDTTPERGAGPVPARAPTTADSSVSSAASQETLREGSVIETVLVNRLDGTFEGPVQCLVTSPVFTKSRQAVLIPAGSRVLGSAAPVRAWGDARLAVRFHRLMLPDGRVVALENATGLNTVGETGLKDAVNRHYWQVFGASLAIGAISGLAQVGTRSGFDQDALDASRQSAGASLASSTARVLDRYLNVLPTVTIREGHRVLVVLTQDLTLPVVSSTFGQGGRS